MIRYRCINCNEKMQGDSGDTKCPLCGGSLVIIGWTYKHD